MHTSSSGYSTDRSSAARWLHLAPSGATTAAAQHADWCQDPLQKDSLQKDSLRKDPLRPRRHQAVALSLTVLLAAADATWGTPAQASPIAPPIASPAAPGLEPSLTDRELYSRAASALLAKNIDQASSELSRLIQTHPASDLAPLAAVRLAECHLATSQWPEAIAVLNQWLPELAESNQARTFDPPLLIKAQTLLGRAYLMSGQYAQLTDLCAAQDALYPDRDKLTAAHSKALAQLDALLTQAKQKQEQSQAIILRTAATAVKDKQYSLAKSQLDQVVDNLLSPAWRWRYQVLRAQCALGQQTPQAALDYLATIKLDALTASEQATVQLVRLDAAIALGKLTLAQQSIDVLQPISDADPKQGAAVALRAVELALLRKDRQSVDQLAAAAKARYPKFESLHEFDLLLARNALAKIEFDRARLLLEAIIQSPPASDPTAVPRARWLLGESYVLSQDFPRAIEAYSQVIATNQPNAWMESSLMQRAKCYQQSDQTALAVEDYRRLVREFPGSALRDQALAKLQELGSPESIERNSTPTSPPDAVPLKEAAATKTPPFN